MGLSRLLFSGTNHPHAWLNLGFGRNGRKPVKKLAKKISRRGPRGKNSAGKLARTHETPAAFHRAGRNIFEEYRWPFAPAHFPVGRPDRRRELFVSDIASPVQPGDY